MARWHIDPTLLPVLELFSPADISRLTLRERRKAIVDMASIWAAAPLPEGLIRTVHHTPTPGMEVRSIIYRPAGAEVLPAVLHIHPGGYVMGTPEMSELSNRSMAMDLNCVVVSVDYRLAPEWPYPAALDDCHAVLQFLWRNADVLKIDRRKIAVVGESAGGGLAAALALRVRDEGEIEIAFQQLFAPMLDDRTTLVDVATPSIGEFVWTPVSNRFGWSSLLGDEPGGAAVPSYASPGRATFLGDLPDTFILVGSLDLFINECLDYGRRLLNAGVPVELHVIPRAFHGFELGAMTGIEISQRASNLAREALRRAFSSGEAANGDATSLLD